MSFPEDLIAAREAAELTQAEAADALKAAGVPIAERTLAGYERGEWEPATSKQRDILTALRSMKGGGALRSGSHHSFRDAVYDLQAGAGDGGFIIRETPTGYVEPPYAMSSPSRRVGWVGVRGDSMHPRYSKGTIVPVLFFEEPPRELREDDVYLFRLEGAVQLKRLQRLSGSRIRVISDNRRYPPEEIVIDDGVDFEIIGRVLA